MPTNAFLGVFAKSPIKPMEDHIKKVHQASKALIPFFNHVFKEEWQEAEEIRLNIRNLEREADEMKRLESVIETCIGGDMKPNAIRKVLNSLFTTPPQRPCS